MPVPTAVKPVHVRPSSPNAGSANLLPKTGQLNIQDLLNNLDIDGDGDIDEEDRQIGEKLKQMDVDGDGMISIKELVNIGKTKLADDKKISNMRKYMIVGGTISLIFIALSLCATIAAIEMTKESRNKNAVMTDASSGKAVATAANTAVGDISKGKKDTSVKDSDGNTATSGIAKGVTVLSSRDLTVEKARAITELTLPVKHDGKSMTVAVTVTGFELAPDGFRCMFYTASGGMVVVQDEDITIYKKSVTGELRTMKVDPSRSTTRRAAARRLAKLRRRRSLLQSDSSFSDMAPTSDSMSPPPPGFSDFSSSGYSNSGYGNSDYSNSNYGNSDYSNSNYGNSDFSYSDSYSYSDSTSGMYNDFMDECPPGGACGSGACTGDLCSPPWCDYGQEYNDATGMCECPENMSLQTDDWGWMWCKCNDGLVHHWYTDSNWNGRDLCLPCPAGSTPSKDKYSCHSCDPSPDGKNRIWKWGSPDYVPGAPGSDVVPTEAGYCQACPIGQHPVIDDQDGYVYEMCQCDNPCMVLEWNPDDGKDYCVTCSSGHAVHTEWGGRWCSSNISPEYGESWCYDPNNVGDMHCFPPYQYEGRWNYCESPWSAEDCPAPLIWDDMMWTCKAPLSAETCLPPMYYDAALDICVSPPVTCEYPEVLDPMSGTCKTLITCQPPMVYDVMMGYCITPAEECVYPMVYDTMMMMCTTPMMDCIAPQIYNPMYYTCFVPMTDVTCNAGETYNSVTMMCEMDSFCAAPMVYDPAMGMCMDCVYPMVYNYTINACAPEACPPGFMFDEMTGACMDKHTLSSCRRR